MTQQAPATPDRVNNIAAHLALWSVAYRMGQMDTSVCNTAVRFLREYAVQLDTQQIALEASEDAKVSLDPELDTYKDLTQRTVDVIMARQEWLRVPRCTAELPNGMDLAEAVAHGFDDLKARIDELEGHVAKLEGSLAEKNRQMLKCVPISDDNLRVLVIDVLQELHSAQVANPPMLSAHDGFGVVREEFEETWDWVKVNPKKVDWAEFKKESVQLTAMGLRFLFDIVQPGLEESRRYRSVSSHVFKDCVAVEGSCTFGHAYGQCIRGNLGLCSCFKEAKL